MCIELDTLRADRAGEIQPAARLEYRVQIQQSLDMSLEIDRITITSQPEVLDCMQA